MSQTIVQRVTVVRPEPQRRTIVRPQAGRVVVRGVAAPAAKGDPGASAYDVWLGLGNVGTEQDFLDSLAPTVSYTHDQASSSTTWVIVHNLGYEPNVRATDSAHTPVNGTVVPVDVNELHLVFTTPVSGFAYLS